MDLNKLTEIISGIDSIIVTHLDTNNFQSTDNNVFYNYELNFDWGATHLNNYITSIDKSEEKWGYIEYAQCNSRCKRCYSSTYTNCYECNVGFKLINKECVTINGYYLKTPANSANTIVPFKIEVDTLAVPNLKQWTFDEESQKLNKTSFFKDKVHSSIIKYCLKIDNNSFATCSDDSYLKIWKI